MLFSIYFGQPFHKYYMRNVFYNKLKSILYQLFNNIFCININNIYLHNFLSSLIMFYFNKRAFSITLTYIYLFTKELIILNIIKSYHFFRLFQRYREFYL